MTDWVLLRGLTRESRHWGAFATQLESALPGARIVALDLPGCGMRNAQRSPASIAGIVESLRSAARESGAATPHHVLALSLGAMAAVEWATRYPREIAGCVLVNTSLRGYSRFHERLRPRNYAALAGLVVAGAEPHRREARILALTSARGDPHASIVREWSRIRSERPVSRANALRQLWAAARYRAPKAAPGVPTLVLASEGDALVDPRCSRELARRWNVPIRIHPDAGHDLPLDDGEWVAAQVRAWVRPS